MSSDEREWVPRELTDDPRAMRALAHPVRLRLLEELTVRGPLTATQCADRVGESPSSCSFHLRMLAKYGFVEEAAGGTGRQRPWRAVTLGTRWRSDETTPAAARTTGQLLASQVRQRDAELLAEHLEHQDALPPEWQDAVIHSNWGSYLTADELREIGEALLEVWRPYIERLRDPSLRPEGARLVHMFAHGFPRAEHEPTTSEHADHTGDPDA